MPGQYAQEKLPSYKVIHFVVFEFSRYKCVFDQKWVSVGGGLTAESVASMAEARGEARSAAPTHTAPAPPGQQHQHQQQHQHKPTPVAGHRLTLHGSRGKQ